MPRIPILMPQLGEAIAEAVVRAIKVAPKDAVEADQEIIEVETNKTNMGVTVPFSGKVAEITAKLDHSYPVGATLGFLEVSEEDAAQNAGEDRTQPPPAGSDQASSPENGNAGEVADSVHFKVDDADDIAPLEELSVRPTVGGLPVPANATGAAYLSPRMKARMLELGLNAADLAAIAGSGAGGRVTIDDFEKFIQSLEGHEQSLASPMRIAVADSMRRSWCRPLATVGRPLLLDRMLVHRKASPLKPGPTLYAMRALAIALAENTAVAGRLVGEKIVHPQAIDIGFAVEVPDGVMVPVIREVDQKPLSEMVQPYQDLVNLSKERRLPVESTGSGIATVTNFGSFGLVWATPIPLPEQNLVLGLGAGRDKPIWSAETETFVRAKEAEITLSFDHRVLDGGAAGRLLARVAELLQTPEDL